jgi:hypothetical protein
MWASAVALVGIISMHVEARGLGLNPIPALTSGSREMVTDAEFREAGCFFKSVKISNFTPNIEIIVTRPLKGEFVGTLVNSAGANSHFPSGGDYVAPFEFFLDDSKVVHFSIVAKDIVRVPANIPRWQMSNVLKIHIARIERPLNECLNASGAHAKIGPLQDVSVSLLPALCGDCDSPQFVSASFQRQSEDSYENRSQRRPRLSMREDLTDFQRNGEQYMILLALLSCAVLGGIAYIYVDGLKYKNPNEKQKQR